MSIEPISGIRPVAAVADAGALAAWRSSEGAAQAREALNTALTQGAAEPHTLDALLAPAAAAAEAAPAAAAHATESAQSLAQALAATPAAPSPLATQALWPGSDWAQATPAALPAAPPATPAPQAAPQPVARPEAVAVASASAEATHLPVAPRERVASPAAPLRSEAPQANTPQATPAQPLPAEAPARAAEVAATPVQLSALHLEQAAAAHVQARQTRAPEVERDPQRRRHADLPELDLEEDPPAPPRTAPLPHEAHETSPAEASPASGWRHAELLALLRLAGQREALRELDQHRRVLLCLPPRQGERPEPGQARRWRLCLMWMDARGHGQLIESGVLWWPGTGSSAERWHSWPAHREQSAAGQDRIVARSVVADAPSELLLRLEARAARQHPPPPSGSECIDLLDPRGTLRALGGQWSITLLRAPGHLDPQDMKTCLAPQPVAACPSQLPDVDQEQGA